jgi:hypothetical protein
MFTTRSFNKQTPVVDGVVFEIIGSNPNGFQLFIQNQDAAKTVVYYFEDSPDGVAYTRIVFSNGGDTNQFSLVAGTAHSVKVISTAARIRMRAYGDAPVALTLTTNTATNTGTTPVTIS